MKSRSSIIVVLSFILLAAVAVSCVSQSVPFTSKKRTFELLTMHAATCPRVPFDLKTSKIVLFSDLHRGFGATDEFRKNKLLFEKILNFYFDRGYSLVLIGDVEEGWGFQRDNVPLILDDHRREVDIEKRFFLDQRYYRIYGNHDDYFRGHRFYFDESLQTRVYPAIILEQTLDDGKTFSILITHGCQGQGLHDAGDDVAALAVNTKYLWLLEVSKDKFRSEDEAIKAMDKARAEYEKHERYVLEWAFGSGPEKKCNILIAGHTHRPVFDSVPDKKIVSVVKKDYETRTKDVEGDIFVSYKPDQEEPDIRDRERGTRAADSYRKRMISKLAEMEEEEPRTLALPARDGPGPAPIPAYFNTGCGYFSEIPCIEISGEKIRLTYISLDALGELHFDTTDETDLEKYK